MKTYTFDAIGTFWSVDIYDSLSDERMKLIISQIRQRIASFEKTYSRFRNDSLVRHIAQKSGSYEIPEDGMIMLSVYKKLYTLTNGRFTPLIGSLLEDAGYDATYSLTPKPLRKPYTWDEVIELTASSVKIKKAALLDFGALGKGALIDIVGGMLQENAISAFCIDAGGDILYKNHSDKPLVIGLEHPIMTNQVIGTTTIRNQSIAASAGNRRKWANFHHVMDPLTLRPVDTLLATWVIADTAIDADALATALFFVEPEKLRNDFSFSYLLLKPDMTILKSDDFPGELYYTSHTS